jgi:excisionase family DNA binding protein
MTQLAALEPVVDLLPVYLTPEQVAKMLQLSAKSLYRLAKSDPTLPMIRLGRGKNASVRFPRERLLKWLRDREQGRAHPMRQQVLAHSNPAKNGAAADA